VWPKFTLGIHARLKRQSAHKYLFVDFVDESDVRKVLSFVGLAYQGPCFLM
jgi:hypothetical protein